jgi:hypothetical protein
MSNTRHKLGVKNMTYGYCGASFKGSSFLTREEIVEILKEYKQDLERESRGIDERIKELELN